MNPPRRLQFPGRRAAHLPRSQAEGQVRFYCGRTAPQRELQPAAPGAGECRGCWRAYRREARERGD